MKRINIEIKNIRRTVCVTDATSVDDIRKAISEECRTRADAGETDPRINDVLDSVCKANGWASDDFRFDICEEGLGSLCANTDQKCDGKKYRIVNGTAYHKETSDKVVDILEKARKYGWRIRIFLGDTATGCDWMETNDTIGYISRSTGDTKVPLLIKNARSTGGTAVLDHCIVKITKDKQVLYQHPSYYLQELEVTENEKGYCLKINEQAKFIFKTKDGPGRCIAFLKGLSNRPW